MDKCLKCGTNDFRVTETVAHLAKFEPVNGSLLIESRETSRTTDDAFTCRKCGREYSMDDIGGEYAM